MGKSKVVHGWPLFTDMSIRLLLLVICWLAKSMRRSNLGIIGGGKYVFARHKNRVEKRKQQLTLEGEGHSLSGPSSTSGDVVIGSSALLAPLWERQERRIFFGVFLWLVVFDFGLLCV